MADVRRGRIDPIWWAPVLVLVIVAMTVLTGLLFSGALRKTVPLVVVSDRAGLVMENGAKVQLRGVQIGRVSSLEPKSGPSGAPGSELQLKIDPEPFRNLPRNVAAEIKSSTAFGAKYVDLIIPSGEVPTGQLQPGAVLRARNVTVEVNTVFENLESVMHAIDPEKLNSVLTAVADAVRGKGEQMGQAITGANEMLLAVNPRMATVAQDWRLFGQTMGRIRLPHRAFCRSWSRFRPPVRPSRGTRTRSTAC